MPKDKNKSAENEAYAMVIFGVLFLVLIKLIVAAILILTLTFGAGLALAYKEKMLQWDRGRWHIVFLSKLKFALMLIPMTIFCAVLAEYYIPTKIKFNTIALGSPKEVSKEDQINQIEGQIKKLKSDSIKKSNEIQEGIVEFRQLQKEGEDAVDLYDKEKIKEEVDEKRSNLLKKNELVKKNIASIPRLQAKLQKLKNQLDIEKNELQDSPVELLAKGRMFLIERNQSGRLENFIHIALGLLAGAFVFSFFLVSLIRDEDLDKRLGLSNVARVFYYFFRALTWISYLFIWPILIGQYFLKKRKRKTAAPLKMGSDRMQLGFERNAYLTDNNLNYHAQMIGGSGAGKSNTIKVMLEDRMAKGHSIIFFDFKADIELMDWIAGASEYYERKDDLVVLSMSDPKLSYAYNPIKHGSETEISSQIMNSMTWSEPFYKNKAEGALLVILKAFCYQRDLEGKAFHLGDLYQFLNEASFRMDVVSAVSLLNYPENYRADLKRICEELTSPSKKENFQSLITQISKILNSSAGEIVVNKIGNDEEFEFKDVMANGKIAYLFMNSLKLKDTASIMGKLMLQDLMKTVGNIYDDREAIKRPTTLIIDEFASFATPDFGEFIEKARGAGISIVVAYQSRKSLDHIEQNLALKINENTATKIVFQVQDSEDVEWFCGLLGTKTSKKETYQAEEGMLWDNRTGQKSVRDVEEYVVHPNQIKNLKLGQALLYCSKVDPHYCIMNIKKANQFNGLYERIPKDNIIYGDISSSQINSNNKNDFQMGSLF